MLRVTLQVLATTIFVVLIFITANAQTANHKTPFDFDGDNKTDLTVYRPSTSYWYILKSSNGSYRSVNFGLSTDRMVPGDYDGDGKTDVAVFRLSTSTWYVENSSTGNVTGVQWGINGDQPIAGDFDGDDKTDYAVFRPADNTWHILRSQAGYVSYSFGGLGDIPVRGDFDGDGKADVAVWRPGTGVWYYLRSSDGGLVFTAWGSGTLGDTVGTGDYDGDGKTDLAVWRSSTGTFYVLKSSGGTISQSFGSGPNGDVPVPGNYDGDTKTDYAVWRVPTGTWYVLRSSDSQVYSQSWGSQALGDKLAPAAFLPTGAIDGTVTSNTGAAINGALVEISEQGVFKTAAVTGSNGYYSASGLMSSKYEMKVSAVGFQATQLTGINVAASSVTTGNAVLASRSVSLEDNFNGSTIDSSKWDMGLIGRAGDAAVTLSQVNQRLKADVPSNSGNVFNGVVSKTTYNLRNAYVAARIVQSAYGFSGANERETHLDVGTGIDNQLRFIIASNGGYARLVIGGAITDLGFFNFSPHTASYIRIRFKPTGTSNTSGHVFFETSPTGLDGSWTLPHPQLDVTYSGFGLNLVKASLNAGNTGNVPGATMALFDDFKFATSGTAIANAGSDQFVTQGTTTAQLTDGGSSSDGGTINGYKWTLVSKPAGAPDPAITSSTSSSTSVTGLTFLGTYGFQLTVTDSNGSASTDSVRVNIVEPAVANTGGSYTVIEDEPIVLNGNASTGAYETRWQFGDGREAEILRATHMYMTPGSYTSTLTVTSETGSTNTASTSVTVSSLPAVTRTVSVPNTYQTLQGALNGESTIDQRIDIVLAAGYDSDPVVLPYRSSTKDIMIRTANTGDLPAKGIRISASDAGNMAMISTPNSAPAVSTEAGASHYRFVGIIFRRRPSNTAFINDLVVLSDPSEGTHSLSNLPHHFVFDRCIFTNGPLTGETNIGFALKRGIALNAGSTTVMNSLLRDFKVANSDLADSQAIGGWSGTGPYAIVNNFLEASTESVMFGGASMKIPYATPSDIMIRGNYFFKPLRWNPNDPAHDGSTWRIKNLFELKHARNVIFDGNVLQNSWVSPNQNGPAMVVTVRDDEQDNPWATIQNVQISNNATDYTAAGINLLSIDDLSPATIPGSNIIVRNNLWDRVGATVTATQPQYYWIGLNRAMVKTWINHNTVFHQGDTIRGETPVIGADSEFRFDNNIAQHNTSGFIDPYFFANRIQLLNAYVPGWRMRKNVITGANPDLYPNDPAPNGINQNRYPDASTFTNQFVNRSKGDYRLAAGSSGQLYATDGTDVGCNISQLRVSSAGSRAGFWTTVSGGTLAADDFDDNARDTFTWTPGTLYGNSVSVTVAEQNGRLEITAPNTTSANWGGFDSIYTLNFTGAQSSVKVPLVVTNAGGETWMFVYLDVSNLYRIGVRRDGGGNLVLVADKVSAGATTNVATVTYNSTNHAWWRIRHQINDNKFYFETSANGSTWTTQGSTVNSLGEEFLTTGLKVSLGAGKQASGATSESTAYFDNLRVGK